MSLRPVTAELSVRPATQYDLPTCLEMAQRFLEHGPFHDVLAYRPEQAERFARSVLNNPQAQVLIGERDGFPAGLFAFLIMPHYFTEDPTAWELFWYVDPEARRGGLGLRLLVEAERCAHERGAMAMAMTAPPGKLEELYRRCGYHPVEVHFERKL